MGSRADVRSSVPGDLELPERYQLIRRIATGGMASVWCAEDRVLGRRVAIKLLSERYAHDETAVRRFKREARVAARLSGHPNIVTIFDVGEATRSAEEPDAPRRAFIVMEHLAGGTVADALRVGAVQRALALRWIRETAAALDYAHGRGVVHRDIKPVNLLLDCDRVVHVADFGIARVGTDDPLTGTGTVLGTAAYIAPEQALGRPATEASDRYSLAVTSFELLVGQRPFAAGQLAAQARAHVEEEPPSASLRNPELPSAVDAVLARGMAKRPEDRWSSAGAFAGALEEAVSEAAAPQATEAFAARKTARGRRTAAAAAAIPAAVGPALGRKSLGRPLALAALAAALLAVVVIALGRTGGGAPATKTAQARRTTASHSTPAPTATVAARPKVTAKPKPPPPARTTTTTPDVTGTAAAATAPTPAADTLEAQGHSLMESGAYQSAIPVLRQALGAAPKSSLTYAYALYDLGRSLRLAGDPGAAARVLWQRMQIPNQTGTVRSELQAALQAMGRRANAHGHGQASGGNGPGTDNPGGNGPPGQGNAQGSSGD